jgi:hypothetical protein
MFKWLKEIHIFCDWEEKACPATLVKGINRIEIDGTAILKTCKGCGGEEAFFEDINGSRKPMSVYTVKSLLNG